MNAQHEAAKKTIAKVVRWLEQDNRTTLAGELNGALAVLAAPKEAGDAIPPEKVMNPAAYEGGKEHPSYLRDYYEALGWNACRNALRRSGGLSR